MLGRSGNRLTRRAMEAGRRSLRQDNISLGQERLGAGEGTSNTAQEEEVTKETVEWLTGDLTLLVVSDASYP